MTREEAIEALNEIFDDSEYSRYEAWYGTAMNMAIEALKQSEQKKGYWIERPIAGCATVRCSVCTELFFENQGKWNFCPHCGAEMEEEK